MRRFLDAVLLGFVVAPAVRADDLTALYPDSANVAFGIDVKGITTSPLGKKVIGPDKPYDATRKLLRVMFPENFLPVTAEAVKPLEAVANKLERVTVVANLDAGGKMPVVVFLEGDIDADEYAKAAEAIAKAEAREFTTAKLGERKLLVIGPGDSPIFGIAVSKSLFVIATHAELITEVLDKHAGKKQAKVQKGLLDSLKKVKPAETPIWLGVGAVKGLDGVLGGTATIGLKDNADFRIEIVCDKDEMAEKVARLLESLVQFLANAATPEGKVWNAAGIVVKQNGKTVVGTGSIPGKLLADEYTKQK